MNRSVRGPVLGFDYGDKRIGVAVGEALTGGARPLATIGPDWTRIAALLREWKPAACVVGLPLAADGAEQPVTTRARQFAAALRKRAGGIPVHTCDERHSSLAAASALKMRRSGGRAARDVQIDAVAACLILEQWLSQNPVQAPS